MTQTKTTASNKAASKLVKVEKNGTIIAISPRQVEQHQRLGWVKVDK